MEERKLTAQQGQQHKSSSNHKEATEDAQAQDPREVLKAQGSQSRKERHKPEPLKGSRPLEDRRYAKAS